MGKIESIEYIEHTATIVATVPAQNIVKVRVNDSVEECGSCPAAALCRGNNGQSNLITIPTRNAGMYNKNDIVTIRGTEKMHHKAIMYATVLPCIILVVVMVTVYLLTADQLLAALCGVGTMIIFFLVLWAARNIIAHEFSFKIIDSPFPDNN